MGLVIGIPQPLRNCPSLPAWERRRGQVYLVFIDETFWRFFELSSQGFFCHAAVGLPEAEYDAVLDETRPIFRRYCELLVPQREFKHAEFKRIGFEARRSLAKMIHDVLHSHGGFISAFYTPTSSFLLERARVNLLMAGRETSLPTNSERRSELLQGASAEVRAKRAGPGMSAAITALLHTPISALLNFAESIDVGLRLVYDPRETRENCAVRAGMLRTAEFVGKMTPATANRLLDVNIASSSEKEVGLQFADLAAGETRVFLDAHRELMEYGASPKLITSTSDETIQAVGVRNGTEYKFGAVIYLPSALQQCFFNGDSSGRTVFSEFTDLLLSGTVTCYSAQGAPRHILPYEQLLIDQLD